MAETKQLKAFIFFQKNMKLDISYISIIRNIFQIVNPKKTAKFALNLSQIKQYNPSALQEIGLA